MHDERAVGRRGDESRPHVAAALAAGPDRFVLHRERVCPPEPPDQADGHGAASPAIQRVVMRDRRGARKQVLEAADEQPRVEWMAPALEYPAVRSDRGPQILDPVGRVDVTLQPLERSIVVQLEVIVGIDQAGQDDRALQVDDRVAAPRQLVKAEDTSVEPHRPRVSLSGVDPASD